MELLKIYEFSLCIVTDLHAKPRRDQAELLWEW